MILKADTVAEKVEWVNKLKTVISSKGGQVKAEIGGPIRQSFSDGSIVSCKSSTSRFEFVFLQVSSCH